jgi:hypothetical protein
MATQESKHPRGPGVQTDEEVELPTLSPREAVINLREYEREVVEELFEAVWPGREPMEYIEDLWSETAANMTDEERHAFANGGLEAAIRVAESNDY